MGQLTNGEVAGERQRIRPAGPSWAADLADSARFSTTPENRELALSRQYAQLTRFVAVKQLTGG